jgi:histidinol-phosphatase (PHP family)
VLDYHTHLWPHGGPPSIDATVDVLAGYCERAAANGVTEIAITEHLYRFRGPAVALAGHWDDDPDPRLRDQLRDYWWNETGADLDRFVEVVLAAKAAGLPVLLGMEVDHYAGRMDRVADLLRGYPFDVLLGSVHWIGAWGFDILGDPVVDAEWDNRAIESVWDAYTRCLEELAASRACDVLAHPDLCKITGRLPAVPGEWYDRMAEAAMASGMAAEVSSAGLRKPVREAYPAPPLLSRFRERGVAVTTASDAHDRSTVADHRPELRALLDAAGYTSIAGFRSRERYDVPLT